MLDLSTNVFLLYSPGYCRAVTFLSVESACRAAQKQFRMPRVRHKYNNDLALGSFQSGVFRVQSHDPDHKFGHGWWDQDPYDWELE